MEPLFFLLFLLLPHISWLYSLHNCTMDFTHSRNIYCLEKKLSLIPSDIPTSTVFLDMSQNNIKSIQQSNFSALTELQTLNLSGNDISHIEDAAFSLLSSLTELRVKENRLAHLTDHTFSGLSNLTVLDLSYNQITPVSEFVFAPLKQLQNLDLSYNNLFSTRDIVNISFCPSLKSLDLSGNYLTSFDSEEFPFPLNITDLYLSETPLRRFALHSDVLPHLQTLHLLSINTELKWDVSDKALLKSLKTLDLGLTNFSAETYQLIFQSLDSLEKLFLRGVGHLNIGLLDWVCRTLQILNLSYNNILYLNDSFLLPCFNLSYLDLSGNFGIDLAPSSLQMLTHLLRLDLSKNDLSKVPLTIRNMSSLTSLSLNINHIYNLSCWDFTGLHQLKVLDLSGNKITELNSCVFQDLQGLEELDISSNSIVNLENSFGTTLPNMKVLNVASKDIKTLQKGVFRNMTHLRTVIVSDLLSEIPMEVGAFDGLLELKTLTASLNNIYSPPADVESPSSSRGRSAPQQVFNLPSLQTLSLIFSKELSSNWPQDLFQGLDNLQILSWKGFSQTPDSKTFHHTPHLLHLQMSPFYNPYLHPEGEFVPVPELFQPLSALQTLDLSHSHIKSLDFLSKSNLLQLQTLILQNNNLSVIDVRALEALPSLRYLELHRNQFVCDCSNADFILWAITNKRVYVNGAFQYKCMSPPSHQGALLLDLDFRPCFESVQFLYFICGSALVLLLLLFSFLHHFFCLHNLLYGYYLLRAALYHQQKMKQGCEEIYDAFVSYSFHDEDWVYRELVPELEERQGWKLCLHHRDFTPGRFILESITDAIYSSRKTLCVISPEYLRSQWCSLEIQMASFRLFDERKDVLVLLLLEELSANQLSPFFRMRKLLRSRTYVSWSGARSHRGLFWERVRRALQAAAQLPADNPLPTDV